ncbi:MAG TPA: NAD(P)-dependent oxidoreductase [Bryobacteraceae bacterium]|jgi:nucleoside-diphosphate-sugar epimerase
MAPSYAGARAVVLGASGFIGGWVARKLDQAGAETYSIVRDATRVSAPPDRIFEADLEKPDVLDAIFEQIRPCIVFNLAGYGVDPSERDENLLRLERLNALLPRSVCEAMAQWKEPKWPGQHVAHVGSALEYGSAGGDLREDGPAIPTTVYGKTKLRGTQAVTECAKRLGLRAVTARLFTVYGPGEHAGRLLPSLAEAARTLSIVELTAGLQQRDLTYIEDVADGLLSLGLSSAEPGWVVNLATGQLNTVRCFAETAAGVLGIPDGKLKFGAIPTRGEEMRHEPVSIDRFRRITGKISLIGIEEGIRRALNYEC